MNRDFRYGITDRLLRIGTDQLEPGLAEKLIDQGCDALASSLGWSRKDLDKFFGTARPSKAKQLLVSAALDRLEAETNALN